MEQDQLYMQRCIELARLGSGYVAPNPMVGAVLVYDGRIIGEGYHQKYGQAHAEVNCINSVKEEDKHLIEKSVIYVSLEPCAHFGKTPPCTDLIIRHKIPTVVVGCRDPFEKVDGKGIERLRNAGIKVITGVLEDECRELNKRFFTYHLKQRPYVILKWAQSKNQKITRANSSMALISNSYSNRLVHKWRSEEPAIMIGTNTALYDNPTLNTRYYTGPDPIRLVVDLNLRLPNDLLIFDKKQKTVIFNLVKKEDDGHLIYYKLTQESSLAQSLLKACYLLHLTSVFIEGGAKLLQSFVEEQLWDEARVIENSQMIIDEGLSAPVLSNHNLAASEVVSTDIITYFKRRQALGQYLKLIL